MGNSNFIPTEDSKLALYLENFAQVCDGNSSTLLLTPAELTEIESKKNAFVVDLQNLEVAKAVQQAATTTKNTSRNTAVAMVRKYARDFKGNTNVSEALLAQLGVISPSTSGPVTTVTNLTVLGCSDGVNVVAFNRNGNSPATNFVIESASSVNGPWFLAGVVTKVKFAHEGNTPGEETFYRVTSIRAGVSSAATPVVVVYPGGNSSQTMSIAA